MFEERIDIITTYTLSVTKGPREFDHLLLNTLLFIHEITGFGNLFCIVKREGSDMITLESHLFFRFDVTWVSFT